VLEDPVDRKSHGVRHHRIRRRMSKLPVNLKFAARGACRFEMIKTNPKKKPTRVEDFERILT
jgi:hypothetical protein